MFVNHGLMASQGQLPACASHARPVITQPASWACNVQGSIADTMYANGAIIGAATIGKIIIMVGQRNTASRMIANVTLNGVTVSSDQFSANAVTGTTDQWVGAIFDHPGVTTANIKVGFTGTGAITRCAVIPVQLLNYKNIVISTSNTATDGALVTSRIPCGGVAHQMAMVTTNGISFTSTGHEAAGTITPTPSTTAGSFAIGFVRNTLSAPADFSANLDASGAISNYSSLTMVLY